MPDYMFLLESRLSPEQRAVMLRVQELSAALGFNVYLTGGNCSRPSLPALPCAISISPWRAIPRGSLRNLKRVAPKSSPRMKSFAMSKCSSLVTAKAAFPAARDDHYVRPGTRPEIRWSTVMEDLRRRDFSLNAIAISLNPASRGLLLLDPTNGLSDIERRRSACAYHSQLHQPAGPLATRSALHGPHGLQDRAAHSGMV